MKKIEKQWERNYPPLKLYKDDLVDIINIVKEGYEKTNPDCQRNLGIQVDEFTIEGTADLDDIEKEVVNSFYIYLNFSPILRLKLENCSASLLVTNGEDMLLMGVANKIDSILQNRQRAFKLFFMPSFYVFLFYLLIVATSCVLFGLFLTKQWYYFIPIFAIIGMCGTYIKKWIRPNHSTIIMSHSNEMPSFFKCNKDKILLSIFVSVITGFVSVLTTLFVLWITKKP